MSAAGTRASLLMSVRQGNMANKGVSEAVVKRSDGPCSSERSSGGNKKSGQRETLSH